MLGSVHIGALAGTTVANHDHVESKLSQYSFLPDSTLSMGMSHLSSTHHC